MIDGPTKKHFIYSLNVDTGATNSGWPVDVNATATFRGTNFNSALQNERGALAILQRNLLIYGFGGVVIPFFGIKLIDMLIVALRWA